MPANDLGNAIFSAIFGPIFLVLVVGFIIVALTIGYLSDRRKARSNGGQQLPQGRGGRTEIWDAQMLRTLGDLEFERLTARVFTNLGFATELTPAGGDGGVDVYARKGKEMYVISCKRYKDRVEPMYVRDIHSVAMTEGATAGFLVTSGHFSDDIRRRARSMRPQIFLIDGDKLADLLNGKSGVNIYG